MEPQLFQAPLSHGFIVGGNFTNGDKPFLVMQKRFNAEAA